jgi:hypothetical protein
METKYFVLLPVLFFLFFFSVNADPIDQSMQDMEAVDHQELQQVDQDEDEMQVQEAEEVQQSEIEERWED